MPEPTAPYRIPMYCTLKRLQISGNHRVNENPEEQARVKAAGGAIAQSDVDGKVAGPLRVWPGGLAMTRSIGDHESGRIVIGGCAALLS